MVLTDKVMFTDNYDHNKGSNKKRLKNKLNNIYHKKKKKKLKIKHTLKPKHTYGIYD